MRVRKSLKVATQTQKSNYYNNIASAWFIAGVIAPFFSSEPISSVTFVRAIISVMISNLFLNISVWVYG